MKIAFVLTQSLDSPSGIGRYGPLTREMSRLGHQMEVIALHYAWDRLSPKTFIDAGVKVNYVGQMHVMKKGSRKLYFSPGRLLLVSLMSTIRLAQAIARSDAEIIHLCKPQPFNIIAAKLSRRGRPLFCDCDDYEAETNRYSNKWQKIVVRYFEDHIVHIVSGLTVNTKFTQQRYIQLGFPQEKIQYVPNGIERTRFTPPRLTTEKLRQKWGINPNTPIIIYIGTLGLSSHPVNLLLEAFQNIQLQLPETRLLLVGGGEDYDHLKQLACKLDIADQTIFTGRVNPGEIPSFLSLATVSVDPVYDDLTARARSPLKILESLAMGIPVVTGDIGDRRLLLADGDCGVLINAGDSLALSNGLLEVLLNTRARERMVNAALAYRKNWYWDHLVLNFLKIYP
ncbi:MAG: glycosyltransferase family 4 protein [Anaerolineae bacterium]